MVAVQHSANDLWYEYTLNMKIWLDSLESYLTWDDRDLRKWHSYHLLMELEEWHDLFKNIIGSRNTVDNTESNQLPRHIYIYIYITLDCSTQPPLDVIFLQLHVNSIASRELLQTNDRKSWTGICVGQEALEIAKHLIIHNPKLRWLIENLPVLWGVSPVTECPIEYLLMIADVELVIGKGQARKQLRHVKQLTTWLYNPNTCHVCVNGKHITTLPAWRGVSNLE